MAWRAARSADPGIGRRGVSEMSRHKISKKFLDTQSTNDDSEVIVIRSDHIHVDTVDMDTYLLAEIKDQQLARLERASREPGHRQPSTTMCGPHNRPLFWDVHLGWRLRDASL